MTELFNIQQELEAPKGNFNSFGKYKYRSCEDILEAVKPILKKYNCVITLSDKAVLVGEFVFIEAEAKLKSEKEEYSVTAYAKHPISQAGMSDSQMTGSASSYARKYALSGLLAIDDQKDDDTQEVKTTTTPVQGYKQPATSTEVKPKATEEQIEGMDKRLKLIKGKDANLDEWLKEQKTSREWVTQKQAGYFISIMDKKINSQPK